MEKLNEEIDDYINKAKPTISDWLQELRSIIHDAIPGVQENIKWGQPVFANPKNVCYIYATKDYAGLGFYDGTKFNDTTGLLEGEGKKLRHIKIPSEEILEKNFSWSGSKPLRNDMIHNSSN